MNSGIHHKILKINSKNAISDKSNLGKTRYSINNIGNDCTVQRIVLKNASINHVFYNVTSFNNYFFVYDAIGGRQYVTIPEGNYNIVTLLAFLNADIAFTSSGTVLTYNTLLDKIITTSPVNFVYEWVDNVNLLSPTAFYLLGLVVGQDTNVTAGIPYTHDHIFDLSGIKNIYIEASFSKSNSFDTTGNDRDICGIVPVDVNYGGVIHYTNQEQNLDAIEKSLIASQNMASPEITLRDVDGNILNMNGNNFELTFKVYMTHNA